MITPSVNITVNSPPIAHTHLLIDMADGLPKGTEVSITQHEDYRLFGPGFHLHVHYKGKYERVLFALPTLMCTVYLPPFIDVFPEIRDAPKINVGGILKPIRGVQKTIPTNTPAYAIHFPEGIYLLTTEHDYIGFFSYDGVKTAMKIDNLRGSIDDKILFALKLRG